MGGTDLGPRSRLQVPELDLHTISDQLVPVQHENAYDARCGAPVRAAVSRQAYVARQSHCNFTPAELVAGVLAVQHRVERGRWNGVATARSLQATATSLGSATRRSSPTARRRSPARTAGSPRAPGRGTAPSIPARARPPVRLALTPVPELGDDRVRLPARRSTPRRRDQAAAPGAARAPPRAAGTSGSARRLR